MKPVRAEPPGVDAREIDMPDIRELQVVNTSTGEVVHRVDVTGKSRPEVARFAARLQQQVNAEEFHISDTDLGGRPRSSNVTQHS